MSFRLVYYSQQDPQWKNERLGFGNAGDTIGYVGCALTSVAMLLSGHGYPETPKTLNQKLKNVNGFAGAAIYWGAVSQIYPKVTVRSNISCTNTPAPLDLIDAAIAAGQPAIVQVDRSPAPGIQTHWVVLYQRKGDDYLMLDPWPYQPDITKEDRLMNRYAQGQPLKRAISHVILYEAYGTSGPAPSPAPGTPVSKIYARVKDSVTWGLNVRSSIDTSSNANVLEVVPAGTQLTLLESDGEAKVGAVNQWVRVRTPRGNEGFVAAWYLENVPETLPAPAPAPVPVPAEQPPPAVPSTPLPSEDQEKDDEMIVVVSGAVGSSGLRLRKVGSMGGALVAVLKAGTRLSVLEPAANAKAKIGKPNQWIHVRAPKNLRGYVSAEYVTLP
jgi:hypothetical protein